MLGVLIGVTAGFELETPAALLGDDLGVGEVWNPE